jgi:RNA polymerase sigma factor (sigma-70 family)
MASREAPRDHFRAVDLLVRTKDKQLKRFLARRVGSVVEAEDLAQEAYTRLVTLAKPEASRILIYRLWRIAHNLAKDLLRLRAIRRRIASIALAEPIGAAPSPEPLCVARQRIALIEVAMEELPSRCQQAFLLRMFEERPFEDVAELVGVEVRTAQRYVARAVAHCQRAINTAEK